MMLLAAYIHFGSNRQHQTHASGKAVYSLTQVSICWQVLAVCVTGGVAHLFTLERLGVV